jgi:hypothetical protein
VDESDGCAYTRAEFEGFYSGTLQWDACGRSYKIGVVDVQHWQQGADPWSTAGSYKIGVVDVEHWQQGADPWSTAAAAGAPEGAVIRTLGGFPVGSWEEYTSILGNLRLRGVGRCALGYVVVDDSGSDGDDDEEERRVDESDGCAYTRAEFEGFYSGTLQWDACGTGRGSYRYPAP